MPSEPRKLTPAQERALRVIVRSNGSGAFPQFFTPSRTIKKLESLGLIQGKSGAQFLIVHTREGLEWVRAKEGRPDMKPYEVPDAV